MRIYLDNAATTPLCDDVLEAMLPYLKNNYGNPSSTHQEGRTARAGIERARKIVAQSINASNSEIFFTSGGTEANNTAIKCSVRDLGVTRIISSSIEHSCVFNTVNRMREENIEIELVQLDENGRADLKDLERLLQKNDKKTLVSLMHANNEVGTLNPLDEIADLCTQYGAFFHTDTVQSIGHIPIDVSKTNISFLSGSGHKLHGPKGVGFLYVNKKNSIDAYIDGGGQERKVRSGTENVASIIGLGKALEQAVKYIEERKTQIELVRSYFISELQANFPAIKINGDYAGAYLFTVLNVSFKTDTPVNMLLFKLDLKGISASGGSACNSGAVTVSRVLATLGVPEGYHAVRFSFSHFNTKAEVDYTIAQLKEII
ncbi:cysteine desulfurase family protein [Aureispira anguillae]|uniref:Cysteine desulfurase n=1 Tax=Aureispira anguillae TaxID=2864201 RepID=A0A915YBE7_9BACT|nr:cysteine desulfurase family protein [Aureispira anguillae]BDS09977.1 cysteine desulfurase [Aureispira anguillae]